MVGTLQKPKIIRPRSCQVLLARINHRTRELRGLVAARSNIPFQVASSSLTEAARAAKASGSFPPVKPPLHSVTLALFSAEPLSGDHLQLPFSRPPTDSLHPEVPNTLFWVQWALQGGNHLWRIFLFTLGSKMALRFLFCLWVFSFKE